MIKPAPRRVRSAIIRFWCLPAEHALYARVAASHGVSVSRWARELLLRAARAEEGGA